METDRLSCAVGTVEVFRFSVHQAESIFTPGSLMSFVVDKVEQGRIFLHVPQFSPYFL